jgi:splicing factor 1
VGMESLHTAKHACSCSNLCLCVCSPRCVTPQVIMPSSVTGENALLDPKVRGMRDELEEINRKLSTGELDLPPEGQRSPSPEPVYDRNGARVNTREIRARDKLIDSRQR